MIGHHKYSQPTLKKSRQMVEHSILFILCALCPVQQHQNLTPLFSDTGGLWC